MSIARALSKLLNFTPPLTSEQADRLKILLNAFLQIQKLKREEAAIYQELQQSGMNIKCSIENNPNEKENFLYKAVTKGHVEVVSKLLEHKADPDVYKEEDGMSLLIYAAMKGYREIIDLLIQAKANLNFKNSAGDSALTLAIFNKQKKAVHTLINANANLDNPTNVGETALSLAVTSKQNEIVHKLLESKANPNTKNQQGDSPLSQAVTVDNQEIIGELIAAKADLDNQNRALDTPLTIAVDNHTIKIADLLIEAKAKIDRQTAGGRTALHYAVSAKQYEMIRSLLKAKANPNLKRCNDMTPLADVMLNDDPEIVRELIEAKADVNCRNAALNTPLMLAVSYGARTEIADMLIEAKADLNLKNNQGKAVLALAVSNKKEKFVEQLIAVKADVDIQDNDGNTPLFLSIATCLKSFNSISALLIDAKSCPNIQNNETTNPLIKALALENNEVLQLLLTRSKLSTLPEDRNGDTPLTWAAFKGNFKVVQKLIEEKANLNHSNKQGRTALDEVVRRDDYQENRLQIISLLITKNALFLEKGLLTFLTDTCDQRDPLVLSSLLMLIRNKNCLDEKIIPVVESQIDKLNTLTRYYRQIVFLELIRSSYFASVMANHIVEYDAPLQHNLKFFDRPIRDDLLIKTVFLKQDLDAELAAIKNNQRTCIIS